MNFANFEAFLQMGGHGLYVWLCYGVGLLVFIVCLVSPVLKKKAIYKELRQAQRREQVRTDSLHQTPVK